MDTIADLKKRIAEGSSESLLFIASWMEAHAKEHEGAGPAEPCSHPNLTVGSDGRCECADCDHELSNEEVNERMEPAEGEPWQCPTCQGWSNAGAIMCIRPGCGEARPDEEGEFWICIKCGYPNSAEDETCAASECDGQPVEYAGDELVRLRGEVIKLREQVWEEREEVSRLQAKVLRMEMERIEPAEQCPAWDGHHCKHLTQAAASLNPEPAESGERCPSCNSDALRTQGGKRGCEECGDVWEPAAPEEAQAEELADFLEASDEVAAEESTAPVMAPKCKECGKTMWPTVNNGNCPNGCNSEGLGPAEELGGEDNECPECGSLWGDCSHVAGGEDDECTHCDGVGCKACSVIYVEQEAEIAHLQAEVGKASDAVQAQAHRADALELQLTEERQKREQAEDGKAEATSAGVKLLERARGAEVEASACRDALEEERNLLQGEIKALESKLGQYEASAAQAHEDVRMMRARVERLVAGEADVEREGAADGDAATAEAGDGDQPAPSLRDQVWEWRRGRPGGVGCIPGYNDLVAIIDAHETAGADREAKVKALCDAGHEMCCRCDEQGWWPAEVEHLPSPRPRRRGGK